MVNKWTPGPWSVESEAAPNGEFQIIAPDDQGPESWNIAKTHGSVGYGEGEIEALANARLIAAAPDLHEALHKLQHAYVNLMEIGRDRIRFLGGDCDPVDVMEAGDPTLKIARAALAKASDGGA